MKVALLGIGTVGTGVYEIINEKKGNYFANTREPVEIVKVLVRDQNKKRSVEIPEKLLTEDFQTILDDDEIEAVIAVMGGMKPEYDYLLSAMDHKKHVITANKAIVSEYFDVLVQKAKENGVQFLFEASVGGGIPVITSLRETMKINRISEIKGILNGTSNYILSKMSSEGRDFEEILAEAQEMGFAEADPSADIDGHDVSRKLSILSSIAFGSHIRDEEIFKRGIREVDIDDIDMVERLGYVLKYIAHSKLEGDCYGAAVEPALVHSKHIMSNVNEEFNIVSIHGNIIGELQFYGKGAGKDATANAVVGDLLYIIHNKDRQEDLIFDQTLESTGIKAFYGKHYLRVDVQDHSGFEEMIDLIDRYSKHKKMTVEKNRIYVMTEAMNAQTFKELADKIKEKTDSLFYARVIE